MLKIDSEIWVLKEALQNFLFEFKDLYGYLPVPYGQSRAIEGESFSQKEVTRPIIKIVFTRSGVMEIKNRLELTQIFG